MKTNTFALLFTLLCWLPFMGNGQERICGTDRILSQVVGTDSLLRALITDTRTRIIRKLAPNTGSKKLTTIPVVFHNLYHTENGRLSDTEIAEIMRKWNAYFNNEHPELATVPEAFQSAIGNPNLRFCLAAETPEGLPSNGIVRVATDVPILGNSDSLFYAALGGSSAWNTERYLNVWIVEEMEEWLGYGFYPWIASKDRDGIVILARTLQEESKVISYGIGIGSRTEGFSVLIHEVGHYFGLPHIWGEDIGVNDFFCDEDDGFSDTPPQYRPNFICPTEAVFPPTTCGSPDMFVNHMDYTGDECKAMFTQQQVDFMHTIIDRYRPGLRSNTIACIALEQERKSLQFSIYPNPARTRIHLSFSGQAGKLGSIEIYTARGRKVGTIRQILFDGNEITLPNLPAGLYFVKIGNQIQKLVIN